MNKVLRRDVFELSHTERFSPGCRVLRKGEPESFGDFLDEVLVVRENEENTLNSLEQSARPLVISTELYDSIEDGDVAMFNGRGSIRVLLSRRANHNTLLVTERCDNRCSFCSQPPKKSDDDWLLTQAAMALAAFRSKETVGISGGEPLLYGQAFVRFLDFVQQNAPETDLHVLSNGRAFADNVLTAEIAKRAKTKVTFGIPLYASLATTHDELVGAVGAFSETVRGLINAGNAGVPVELRFIPTQANIEEIVPTMELVLRCFSNISQVSIMNLEPTGWARQNWSRLYCDPSTYANELVQSVNAACGADLPVILFNYPLCHLPKELHSFAVQSISDWKNFYPEECDGCALRSQCSGYFSSSQGKFHQSPRRIT